MGMRSRGTWVAILAFVAWVISAQTTNAQISVSRDSDGNLVYINEDSSTLRHGSTINSPAMKAVSFSTAAPSDKLDQIVEDAAQRHSVDPALVKAVITTESGWNPRAISSKGAVGLMQLIPGTAQRFGVGNRFDPAQNIEGGTAYLRNLLDRYDGDLNKTLAAYNAGERAVDLTGGIPAYRETRRYVQKVTDAYFRPESGRNPLLWSPRKPPVRREVDSDGRVMFTNE